jgi:hypothetical protein
VTLIRRHLTAVGIAWLLFQAVALAFPSLASCCVTASQAAVDDDVCCKGMAPGQMCPLHKHRQAPKDSAHHDDAPAGYAMRSGCAPVDPSLISLAFGLGILPPPVSLDVIPVSISVPSGRVAAVHQARALDPPPPRA